MKHGRMKDKRKGRKGEGGKMQDMTSQGKKGRKKKINGVYKTLHI